MCISVIPSYVDINALGPPDDVQARLRNLQPVLVHNLDVLLGVEGLDAEVLVPKEDVLIWRHDAGVHEPLGTPPTILINPVTEQAAWSQARIS